MASAFVLKNAGKQSHNRMLKLRFHLSHTIFLTGFFKNIFQTGRLLNIVRKWVYWVCKTLGKKCDWSRAEYSSQIRWQHHSAYRAGEGEALQSCLCSSTPNVFFCIWQFAGPWSIQTSAGDMYIILCPRVSRYQLTALRLHPWAQPAWASIQLFWKWSLKSSYILSEYSHGQVSSELF